MKAKFSFKIQDVFEITNRPTVVITGEGINIESIELGDEVCILNPGSSRVIYSTIVGIEHYCGMIGISRPKYPLPPLPRGYCLRGVKKEDIEIGAEVRSKEMVAKEETKMGISSLDAAYLHQIVQESYKHPEICSVVMDGFASEDHEHVLWLLKKLDYFWNCEEELENEEQYQEYLNETSSN